MQVQGLRSDRWPTTLQSPWLLAPAKTPRHRRVDRLLKRTHSAGKRTSTSSYRVPVPTGAGIDEIIAKQQTQEEYMNKRARSVSKLSSPAL
jgi:hypothetical protein